MGDEGQEQANAKDRQRLLTASDERLEYWPFKSRPVDRNGRYDKKRQARQINHAVGRKISLVVRNKQFGDDVGNELPQLGNSLRQSYRKSKEKEAGTQDVEDAGMQESSTCRSTSEREPGSKNEE